MSAFDPKRTSGNFGCCVVSQLGGCQMSRVRSMCDLSSKKRLGTSHRNDVCRPCDTFQLAVKCLNLRSTRPRQQRIVNHPETAIQSTHAFANEPQRKLRRIVENRNDDRYDRHQHCDELVGRSWSSRKANTGSGTKDHFCRNRGHFGRWDIPDRSAWEIRRPSEKVPACCVPPKLPVPEDR